MTGARGVIGVGAMGVAAPDFPNSCSKSSIEGRPSLSSVFAQSKGALAGISIETA